MFSVNVLTYGDYPFLTSRCLQSILDTVDPAYVSEVRIGMNEVSPNVRKQVFLFQDKLEVPCFVYEEVAGRNVLKYPLMRRMLYDTRCPVAGTHVMWFDDDSFVRGQRKFWADVATEIRTQSPAVMGSVYRPGQEWSPREKESIAAQPWYGGVALTPKPFFATGGWWVADLKFLRTVDYPIPELKHNGGDVLLGEMVRQQKQKLHHYRTGVAINADPHDKESAAIRRGLTTPRPFQAKAPYDYTHHNFAVKVRVHTPEKG